MSPVALEELCQQKNPDYVMVMPWVMLAWAWRLQTYDRKPSLQTRAEEFYRCGHLPGREGLIKRGFPVALQETQDPLLFELKP